MGLLEFSGNTTVAETPIDTSFSQKSYAYTFSITLNVNSTSCFTRDPVQAAQSCNLFLLQDVFMLYFEMPNMARFHFYASKNYYESQSKAFFIPYD